MAVLLQFDYNKRLGLPAFSSHSFGITMKAEVTDLEKIGEEAERAYGLLQSAVDSQIVHSGYISLMRTREKTEPIKSKKHK